MKSKIHCESCGSTQCSSIYCFDCKSVCDNRKDGCGFEILGVPSSYMVDSKELEQKYLALCKAVHPDHCSHFDSCDRAKILQTSALVNQAYKDVKDRFKRAEILLNQISRDHGVSIDQSKIPPMFLMDVLELQEEIDEIRLSKDKDLDRLEEIISIAEKKQCSIYREVETRFCRLEKETEPDVKTLCQAIRISLNCLKYYKRIIGVAEEVLEESE